MTSPVNLLPSNEDMAIYERNINQFEKEVFERQQLTIQKSQEQTRKMVDAFDALKENYDNCELELNKYKKRFYTSIAISCCVLVGSTILYLASECK